MDTRKKDAIEVAKQVISFRSDYENENGDYGDEESGHTPKTPENVFIYEARMVDEFANEDCEDEDCYEMAVFGKNYCEEHKQ